MMSLEPFRVGRCFDTDSDVNSDPVEVYKQVCVCVSVCVRVCVCVYSTLVI